MNKLDNRLNIVVFLVIFGIVLCLLKDFISIRSYNVYGTPTNEKFYNGIILDAYNCSQYSTIQIKFKWNKFNCDLDPSSKVLSIKDKTKELNNYVCDGEIEEFYKDEVYTYYFNCKKSEYVIVEYDNGYTESIKEALKNKRVTVGDLDTYSIEYSKKEIK